jgi:class 3 adenylate cyclase
MRQAAKAVHQDISIGITTGSVYCGTVGSPLRQEYVAIGRTVNLAARLMGKAKGRVLVDAVTHSKLSANVTKHMQQVGGVGRLPFINMIILSLCRYAFMGELLFCPVSALCLS